MKNLDKVSKRIGKDAEILSSLNCEMHVDTNKKDRHKGMLVATDKGLFFYDTEDMNFSQLEGVDYSQIDKIECNRGLVKSNIFLNYGNMPVKFYNIVPGSERELLEVVNSKISM